MQTMHHITHTKGNTMNITTIICKDFEVVRSSL